MFSMVRYKMVQVKLGQSSLNKKVYQTSQFWVWLHDLEPHLPILFREIRMMPCENYLWGKPVTWLSLDQTSSDYLRGLIWLNILDGFCWISFFRSLASPAAHGNAVMEGWRFCVQYLGSKINDPFCEVFPLPLLAKTCHASTLSFGSSEAQTIYLPCTDWKVFEKSTDLWATKGLDLPRLAIWDTTGGQIHQHRNLWNWFLPTWILTMTDH